MQQTCKGHECRGNNARLLARTNDAHCRKPHIGLGRRRMAEAEQCIDVLTLHNRRAAIGERPLAHTLAKHWLGVQDAVSDGR
jgi:hypothetical protein